MKTIEFLIVTCSVVLQQGLSALLESLPEVPNVKSMEDLQDAYIWMEEHQPRIVLLDERLVWRDPKSALEKIRMISSQTQRILLVDNVEEKNLLITHAEAILIKGTSPSAITTMITILISAKGEKNEPHPNSNQ